MENVVMSNDNTGLTCSGPDGTWPIPRKYALYTAAIIFLLGMFDLISRQVIVSLFPHIKEEFALSDKQLGMLVASVNVAISLLVVPTAYLVDRWSRKKMIFLMGVVWSLSTLLGGFATSFSLLLIARMLCGFGEAGYQPAGQSLLTACFPRKFRATATAIVTCGMTIGAPIGLVVGAFVAEHWGWRHAFGVVAVPGLLLSFLALRMHDFRVADDSGEKAARREKRKGQFIPAVRNILKTPTIVCVILCAVCIRLFNSVLMTWLPTYFTRVAEVPMTTASSYASLIILMSSLAVFYGGPLLDWLKNRNERLVPVWLTFVMFLSGFLNFTAYTFLRPGSLEQVALLVISGCFFGTLLAAGSFLILDLTSATSRATAISLMILSQNLLGYGLGPIVTGTLSDMFSISFAMTVASTILFVGGAIYAVCIFTYPRDKEKAECVDITFHA